MRLREPRGTHGAGRWRLGEGGDKDTNILAAEEAVGWGFIFVGV